MGEALWAWSKSFSNFDHAGQGYYGWYGWSEATLAEPCSWSGILCLEPTATLEQQQIATLELRDFGLNGEPVSGTCSWKLLP